MPKPRARTAPAAALTAVLALTACGAEGSATTAAPGASTTAREAPKPPEQICAEVVGYWAERELRGDSGYGDYQSRGLSDSQNNILLDVVAEAKAQRRKHGARAAAEFAEHETAQRCAELHENGGPTSTTGGWPG